jgi:hypothetical protein
MVRLGFGLLCLLGLATVGAFAVDAFEVTAPALVVTDPCGHANALLDTQNLTAASCQWGTVMAQSAPRSMQIRIDVPKTGSFQAIATIATVPSDPLVAKIQHGDARDANSFFEGTFGSVADENYASFWSPPTVTIDPSGATATISVSGRSSQSDIPSQFNLRLWADRMPGSVEVQVHDRIIGGFSGAGTVVSESGQALVVKNPTSELRIMVEPGDPQQFGNPPGPKGSHWVSRAASATWRLVSGFTGLAVPAAAWIGLFLASRMGAFGGVGKRPAWRRMERVLGTVVVVDLTAAACSRLVDIEGALTDSFNGGTWQLQLGMHMTSTGLWSPIGYPTVSGGVVLLAALAIAAAAWNPHRPDLSLKLRRLVPVAVTALAVVLGMLACETLLVLLAVSGWRGVVETVVSPGGIDNKHIDFTETAVVIPASFLVLLFVLFLAGAWIVGDGSSSRSAMVLARTRTVVNRSAFGAAAAAIGLSLAGFLAFRHSPLGVEPFLLWAGGSIAWLFALMVLLVPLLMVLRVRRPLSGIALLVSVAAAGLVPIGLIGDLVTRSVGDGDEAHVSGGAVFVICLLAAVTFVTLAMTVLRPGLSGRRMLSYVWVVPFIVVLGAAATLTSDSGYLPTGLRWGVPIIAGASLGIALTRLGLLAVGPLGASSGRLPRGWAVAFVAVVVAVPWGDVGHGVMVSWWELLTYVNRLDALLPLLLVAGSVVTLRRLGWLSTRDELALAGQRRLGIGMWIVVLAASYTFGATADWSTTATLAAAAVAAWILMPREQVGRAAVILGQTEQEAAAALRRVLEVGMARRVLPSLAKAMRDKVASGDLDFAQAQAKVAALEQHTGGTARNAAGGGPGMTIAAITDPELAFGALISPRPWLRARWGVSYAAVAGAPWVVLGLAGASVPFDSPESYPELAFVSAVAPLVLRWMGYGLLFGYFFPLLRGKTGLNKGLSFFGAALAPSVLSALASPATLDRDWHSAALLGVQLLIFSLIMGLLADLAVLRHNGLTTDRLVDLHSLWTVSAWASSVVVAVGTGVATVIIAGLQPFVIGVITPSQPSTPPAAVSHQP